MISAAEAYLMDPKLHTLEDEIRQLGYAVEETARKGQHTIKWKLLDPTISRVDLKLFLDRLGYFVFAQDGETITISW